MGRGVTRFFLTCLLAWVTLALVTPASAITQHCGYRFIAESEPNVHGSPISIHGQDFLVKGRYKLDCDVFGIPGVFCVDDRPWARMTAARGAARCIGEFVSAGLQGRPPSCMERQSHGRNADGYDSWSQVVEWNVGIASMPFSAQRGICDHSRGQIIETIKISVETQAGYNSECNISGRSRAPIFELLVNGDPCANVSRPLPPDPTMGLPPPPSEASDSSSSDRPPPPGRPLPQGLDAAPDLKVDKSAGQETCLPNQKCKFKVKVINDGTGPFKGPLTVSDTITPASERLVGFGPEPWNCEGRNGRYTCRHPETELRPGQSVDLSLAFMNTDKARGTVENCASIDWEVPPLEGICTAAIEEALARERENMDDKTASETDKAVKEYQCKSDLPETGKPDAQLLRLAFKSIGMGDTNRDNDTSCAASSIDIPLPETVGLTPETTQCTGGRVWNVSTRKCACPPDTPNWTGRECTTEHVYETPEACTGGRFRSRSTGECLCPALKPAWDGKQCRPRGRASKPPPAKPAPSATGPSAPAPACTGGRYWDVRYKSCRCPSNVPRWDGKKCSRRLAKPTPAPRPPTPSCSGGRTWNAVAKSCVCPGSKPVWTGSYCKAWKPAVIPGLTSPSCAGGMYWDKKRKACRCPSSKPVWNAKQRRCEAKRSLTGPPTTTPPTTTAPTATAPSGGKIVCRGGKMVGALCWCGIGKLPKKVGSNVYQCQ